MKNKNTYLTREAWLMAATDELRPYFEKLGYILPHNIRFAIAFTSTGKRGRMVGECWHPDKSEDQHYELIIRADIAEPVEVLGILVHELIHTVLSSTVKHGKEFRDVALRIGLQGKMRQTTPTQILQERLQIIANNLGSLPHAKLNFATNVEAPKKQAKKWLKAECGKACGYSVRITSKWANVGLPLCPVHPAHGLLICDRPDDADEINAKEK